METILPIIFIVFGVLQIILFFKLWGMTNDIREIKDQSNSAFLVVSDAKIAYLNGDKETAKNILDKIVLNKLNYAASMHSEIYPYSKEFIQVKTEFTQYYEELGLDLFNFDKYKDLHTPIDAK